MRTACILPYCPWPPDTGTRVEMMKHLEVLRDLGECCLVSARSRPVGFGWTDESVAKLREQGFNIRFREDETRRTIGQLYGTLYACLNVLLKRGKAFGHANAYHQYAFPRNWLTRIGREYDLCVFQYSFWSDVLMDCPKAVVVHELLSNYHVGGCEEETRALASTQLVLVVGYDEVETLTRRGVGRVFWSPPAVAENVLPCNEKIGLIGTRAPQNIEGLQWLESVSQETDVTVHLFGNLAELARKKMIDPVGRYEEQSEPYERCGIHLLTRPDRPGLQIKAVEALAHGRAIVARRGSMRGLPEGEDAWITVDSPEEMLTVAYELSENQPKREALSRAALKFHRTHLGKDRIINTLRELYNQSGAGK